MAGDRLTFRPDIEGLRGIAILLVVAFHAGVRWVPGAFIAVDVFFVLSGYFITALIARELARNGEIDLPAFYGRRAVRLLPTLFVVLLATLAAVMFLYAPIDRAAIAATSRSVALYSSNVEFARDAVNYFFTGDHPLLHTWSLAVEEQFYLIWPLLFVLVAFIGGRRLAGTPGVDGGDDRRRMLAWIIAVGAVSFAISVWLNTTSQPWAFFGMPTRIWEFALGGALALMLTEPADEPATGGTALQVAGLVALALAVLLYDRGMPHPGFVTLLPTLGTVALLVGGRRAPTSGVSRALGAGWLQWLGRHSYAWYLWHWPLVGIGAVLNPAIGVPGRLTWSFAGLGMSWLTYRLIETPARNGNGALARIPTRWVAPLAFGASALVAVTAHVSMEIAERQAARPSQRPFAAARMDRMEHDCWTRTVETMNGPCEFGDRKASRTIVLLGDSHAEHWLGGLDRIGREHGWKVVALIKGGCPVAELRELGWRTRRHYEECARFREAMIRRIIAMRPALVMLSNADMYVAARGTPSDWQVDAAEWHRGLRRTYSRLADAGIATVVMRDNPSLPFDAPRCLSRRAARLPLALPCEYDRAAALSPAGIAAQNAAARGLPIRFVDMNDRVCATKRCPVARDGVVIFTDDNHLTASFSRLVAPVLAERLAAPRVRVATR